MIRTLAFIVSALLSGPAAAQVMVTTPQIDAETLASTLATVMPACPIPLADTLNGGSGSAPVCAPRPDATRPTIIQAQDTTTATDATWSVTFARPFVGTPIYVDARVYGQNQPYICTVLTSSATGATGKCFQLVSTTLPNATLSLLGLVLSPVSSAGSGLSVRVVARQ